MVPLEVHVQKLLLSERFLTLAAGKRLLPRVCALVHYHVALLDTTKGRGPLPAATTFYIHPTFRSTHLSAAVVALVTLETLLVLVGLLVLNESVALVKDGVAVAAFLPHLDK